MDIIITFVWIVRFSKIFIIVFVISSSDKVVVYVVVYIVHKFTSLSTTLSDEEMTKIKVIDLEKLYNFVVDNFLIWNHFVKENYVWISKI